VQAELIEGDSEENYSSVENANFYVDEDSTVKIRVFTQTYYRFFCKLFKADAQFNYFKEDIFFNTKSYLSVYRDTSFINLSLEDVKIKPPTAETLSAKYIALYLKNLVLQVEEEFTKKYPVIHESYMCRLDTVEKFVEKGSKEKFDERLSNIDREAAEDFAEKVFKTMFRGTV
jgi:hypothetical protein